MSESTKGFLISGFIAFVAMAAMVRETFVEGEPGLAMGIAVIAIGVFLAVLAWLYPEQHSELGEVTKDKDRDFGAVEGRVRGRAAHLDLQS